MRLSRKRASSVSIVSSSNTPFDLSRRIAARWCPAPGTVATAAALTLGLAAAPAFAKTFTVNQFGAAAISDAGNGVCDATCTLRDAIENADALAGPDIIKFKASTVPQTIRLDTTKGEMPISDALTITGPGAGLLTIDGDCDDNGHDTLIDTRIFLINTSLGKDVLISGMRLTGGNGRGGFPDGRGGALHLNNSDVTLSEVTLEGNFANDVGGGVKTN